MREVIARFPLITLTPVGFRNIVPRGMNLGNYLLRGSGLSVREVRCGQEATQRDVTPASAGAVHGGHQLPGMWSSAQCTPFVSIVPYLFFFLGIIVAIH